MHEELTIRFAQAVAHTLWQGVAIGLLAWALVKVFRKRPARQHGVLCGAMLLLAVCLPVNVAVLLSQGVDSITPPTLDGELASSGVESGSALTDLERSTGAAVGAGGGARVADELLAVTPAAEAPAPAWSRVAPWVVGFYAAGLVAMSMRLAFAWHGGRRLRKRAWAVRETPWLKSLEKSLMRLALKTRPVLRWSEDVAAPVLVGLAKPMILLPVALANQLTLAQAEAVLAHELAHLRRRDHWVLAMQRLVETVLFYHPVVWWLSRELNRTREEACDDLVLGSGAKPADYAEALVLCSEARFERAGLATGAAVQLAASGGKGSSLRKRVMRVLGKEETIRPGRAGWWMVGVMVAVAAIVVAGAVPEGEESKANEDLAVSEDPPEEQRVSDAEEEDPILAIGPQPAAIKAELVIAEVPADYAVNEKSMTREALNPKPGVDVMSMPTLVLEPGKKGVVEVGARREGAGKPPTGMKVELVVERRSNGKDYDVARYHLIATCAHEDDTGAVRSQGVELMARAPWGEWAPFEIGALGPERKLAGAIRLMKVDAEPADEAPRVFRLLPDGRVRWKDDFYTLEELKDALPKAGEGPVFIEGGKETPYREVVELMEVLVPVFGQNVKFRVAQDGEDPMLDDLFKELRRLEGEWGRRIPREQAQEEVERQQLELLRTAVRATDDGATVLKNWARLKQRELRERLVELRKSGLGRGHPAVIETQRLIELLEKFVAELDAEAAEVGAEAEEVLDPNEAQLVQCRRELQAMEAEREELLKKFTDDHPQVRRIERRMETAEAYIRDLEAALVKRKAAEADASADGNAAVMKLLERAAQANPEVALNAEIERMIRRRVAETELAERQRILEELRVAGRGAEHPEVIEMERRIEALREVLEESRDEDEAEREE